jgi:hypothetical protein
MSKQDNAKPEKASQPAASGSGSAGKTIGTKPIRRFDGPSIETKPVGPKNAPFYAK